MGCSGRTLDPFLLAYDANYLIDNKTGIIVDAEGTRASRISLAFEIAITRTMLDRVRTALPASNHSDSQATPPMACGETAQNELMDRKIAPHVPGLG